MELPRGFSPLVTPMTGRWLLGDDRRSVDLVVVDLVDESVRSIRLPDVGRVVPETVGPGRETVLIEPSEEGMVMTVDLRSGSVHSLGTPGRVFGWSRTVGDTRLYSTLDRKWSLVVPLDMPSAAFEVEGYVVDVNGGRVLTIDGGFTGNGVSIREAGGPTVSLADAPGFAAMLTDAYAWFIDADVVWSVDPVTQDATPMFELSFQPEWATPLGDGLLLAVSRDESVLLDTRRGVMTPPLPGPISVVTRGSQCVALQRGSQVRTSGADAVLLDLRSAEGLMSFDATPQAVTPDGCSVLAASDPSVLFVNGSTIATGLARVQAASPWGTWVIGREGASGPVVLRRVGDGQTFDLSAGVHQFALV